MAKHYYNGVLLPEIPTEHLSTNPYAWIRKNQSTGYYDLALSNDRWYYSSSAIYPANSDVIYWYRIPLEGYESYNEWVFKEETTGEFGVDANHTLLWCNDDISDGSLTSKDVYLAGSCAILENARLILVEKIEAETGTLTGSAIVSDRADSSGNVVVDYIQPSTAGTLTLNFTVPKSDYYVIRMSFTHSGTRDFKYVLNGKTYLQSVVGTSYYSVEKIDFQMYLNEGSNSVLFKGGTTTYAPMFDSFEILKINTNMTKYLVRNNDIIYTVAGDSLVEVSGELCSNLFIDNGVDVIPDGALLMTLSNPEVLCWTDDEILPTLTATVKGIPFPQTLVSVDYDMTHSSILGIEKVTVDATNGVLFAVSFDSGESWKIWTGQTWGELSEENTGMSAEIINSITSEQWNEVATTGKFRFRVTLSTIEDKFKSLIVDYVNA